MARFVYAKIYCDILRHPLLRDRPDSDVRLVLGLLLEAKEHTDDGVLRRLTAESARGLCHIKAPVRRVQEGLDYLVAEGWLIPRPDQSFEIKDFVARQAADSPAQRMSRSRDRKRDAGVTKRNSDVSENVTPSSPEVEGEEERDQQQEATDGGKPEKAPASPLAEPLVLIPPKPLSPLLSYLAAEFPQAKADHEWEEAQKEAYPGIDLLAESKAARAWELSNPKLIKTQKRRFLGNWFAKAQNDLRRPAQNRPGAATLQITPDARAEHAIPGRKFL